MAGKRKRQQKERERKQVLTGYKLFTKDYYKEKKKKKEACKPFKEENQALNAGWKALSDGEREKYKRRATKLRSGSKPARYLVPFHTRCAPRQFMNVCNNLKRSRDKMDRLRVIGFEKLVDICSPQIPRYLCGEFIGAFDPPTRLVSIRGMSRSIGPGDVNELMGLPYGGKEIGSNVSNDDASLKSLRSVYGAVPYKTIAKRLIEANEDPDFELLFVMYTLGTLLYPSSSVKVSERVLKVLITTKEAFQDFDWCAFVFKELCFSVGDFKKKSRKGKVTSRVNVGGCLYFLMIFCLHHFPFGQAQSATSGEAMAYWDEDKVKSRVELENESNQGLLYDKTKGVRRPTSNSGQQTMFTHPEIQQAYERLMSKIQALVQEELLALQSRLLDGENVHEGQEDSEDVDPASESEHEQLVGESEDGVSGNGNSEAHVPVSTNDGSQEEGDERRGNDDEVVSAEDIEPKEKEQQQQLRKSSRVKKPAIGSPWVTTMGKKRTKEEDDKKSLYQLCTTRCNQEEALDVFVAMYDTQLCRGELYCLRPRGWINSRVMSMVGNTLMGDELEKHGRVSRHIFAAEFMIKMSGSPEKWSWAENKRAILPKHVGYNIGDCDFIFGPTVFLGHWFCYVLEIKTMRFYLLDSLVDHVTYYRLQHQQQNPSQQTKQTKATKRKSKREEEDYKNKERMAISIRDHFYEILRQVKPQLFAKGKAIPTEITWGKVHVQCDKDSCGVHVISWLEGWDGAAQDKDGYTMPKYSEEQIQKIKVDSLWWLITHEKNVHAEKVLALIQGNK